MTGLYLKTEMGTVPLADISRQDATALCDVLLEKMVPNSGQRVIATVKAAVNHAIFEGGGTFPICLPSCASKGQGLAGKTDCLYPKISCRSLSP